MGKNKYFSHSDTGFTPEKSLLESMVAEAIKINGQQCFYIPRESWSETGPDYVFGEDVASRFSKAYTMEMYISTPTGWGGDLDFFSRFGLEIRNNINFQVAQRSFEQYVPVTVRTRPQGGDLIYVPVMNAVFEVKFVENDLFFFQLANTRRYIYEMRCELFRYSNETVDTGVPAIDDIFPDHMYTIQLTLASGNNDYQISESVSTNTANAVVSDWNPTTRQLYVIFVNGTFIANTTLIGATSNAHHTITNVDDLGKFSADNQISDNRQIQTEANSIFDLSEVNPLGNP